MRETRARENFWAEEAEKLFLEMGTDRRRGLTEEDARERLLKFGANRISERKKRSKIGRYLAQFFSPVVVTLLIAAGVSAFLGEWVDAIAIAAILIANSFIGYFQEAKAEAAVEALKKLSVPRCRVFRNGEIIDVSSDAIVPGDLLALESGDFIPADGRVVEANQLAVDEAVLTGESLPVHKQRAPVRFESMIGDRTNSVFAGTAVAAGSGRVLVIRTGMETEIGRIADLLESTSADETPLQKRLAQVSSRLLLFCFVVVLVVAGFGITHGESAITVLMSAISLAVAAVPEGLPTVVTLALALAVHRMTRKNAIIRNLTAVETLGSTTVICTDKTGTLTTGKMRVREVFLPNQGIVSAEDLQISDGNRQFIEALVLNSNASISQSGGATGDTTEIPLLFFARDRGIKLNELRGRHPRLAEWSFDSGRKRMSVAVREKKDFAILVKGAPESIIPLCNLSAEQKNRIEAEIHKLSSLGRRLLAVARRDAKDLPGHFSEAESDLAFLGIVSIADPPRLESMEAIERCRAAGIRVVMITGDHPVTAKSIARELGIVETGAFDKVVTGQELEHLSFEELKMRVPHTAVYARVSPEHKLRIVKAWKSLGEVVAMTGDGVNDAPALKEASVGISMGRGGTEVARQASSMVLSDDNFATIVSAIEEGRAVYGNIRRTIQYLLSGNFAEILIMLGAVALGWPLPLAPIHLLWINLVTDGFPALALAAEPVPRNALQNLGRPSPTSFLDKAFIREIVGVGVVTTALALGVYGYSLKAEGELTARTHIFSFLVFAELFRSFACRSETKTYFHLGPKSNLYHVFAVALPVGFQILLHHSPTFQTVFQVHTITWGECLLFLGLTLIPVSFLKVRKIFKKEKTYET